MIRAFENGDIVTSGNQFLDGKEATGQGIVHRLRTFLGEYFLDVSDGTPWFQSILGKTPDGIAEAAIKQRILSAPDVVNITAFRFERDGTQRRISVDADVIDVNNEQVRVLLQEDL
ncbi:Phage protein [Alloalcanivorax xenomutans]|uniref:hypothetical protein n=1 Tax=Alloalcanivorax xenomutans TaxID=1094342 RepID=UPI0006D5C723|nr:hypothetical protein [Alloalcanivorax xenomutans]CUR48502.1 Phage protein [Alloalcanivorax xenomutans]